MPTEILDLERDWRVTTFRGTQTFRDHLLRNADKVYREFVGINATVLDVLILGNQSLVAFVFIFLRPRSALSTHSSLKWFRLCPTFVRQI